MTRRRFTNLATIVLISVAWASGSPCGCAGEEPSAAAVSNFNTYISGVELRIHEQHRLTSTFLAPTGPAQQSDLRLHWGELIIERLTPGDREDSPGSMLHHWRGTAFAKGAKAADFERLMKDFGAYPKYFSPQVLRASVVTPRGGRDRDRFEASMRIRQRHVITVVMDTDYDVAFGRLDLQHGFSVSRSTRIAEVDSAGTRSERELSPSEENGFLWRLNTYWSYEERDGGLYLQIESISMTRSIPRGLGWALRPFVESVPRDSLEFTLRAVCDALRK
jgi:hypothetical protein